LFFSELLSACNITLPVQHYKKNMVTLEPEEERGDDGANSDDEQLSPAL
jgi:hypothetical protein